ncbi:MAG TPA: hypothetical protein VGM44_10195 [Polyangiaceae bacterium]|jgi:hypothetical protein
MTQVAAAKVEIESAMGLLISLFRQRRFADGLRAPSDDVCGSCSPASEQPKHNKSKAPYPPEPASFMVGAELITSSARQAIRDAEGFADPCAPGDHQKNKRSNLG